MSHNEHEPDLIECRKCESTFDLARMEYYDNICPKCKEVDVNGGN